MRERIVAKKILRHLNGFDSTNDIHSAYIDTLNARRVCLLTYVLELLNSSLFRPANDGPRLESTLFHLMSHGTSIILSIFSDFCLMQLCDISLIAPSVDRLCLTVSKCLCFLSLKR